MSQSHLRIQKGIKPGTHLNEILFWETYINLLITTYEENSRNAMKEKGQNKD